MTRRDLFSLAAVPAVAQSPAASARKLLVISIDGLDHRYLRDADRLGVKIPTLRRLLKEGLWADGVVGEVPTVTWPSHTSMLTGVPPRVHGILNNRRPAAEGGEYYWTLDLCRVPTLWHAARAKGAKTAGITWPVTVTELIDFNLPEYFRRRRGGAMDLRSIESKCTPGLVAKIASAHPSFAQEWMDDRARTLATQYILKNEQPDFFAVHFVDLDSEQHDNGPFTREAFAILEYTDELLARILESLPARTAVAIVSDHGFMRVRRTVNLRVLQQQRNLVGNLQVTAGLVVALDDAGAAALEVLGKDPTAGIGRRVSALELARFAPTLADAKAAFEPAEEVIFGNAASGDSQVLQEARGDHGLWPGRPDYRATFLLWGSGIAAGRLPEVPMTGHARRFADILGLSFPA
jgi:predicted AlkP superfamily pyrophosphatase or phosphodiesterase